MLMPALSWSACPLWTYQENPKLDQDMNNICAQIKNSNGTNLSYSSGTFTYINASSITVANLYASSGSIKSSMVLGTATNDDAPAGRFGEYVSSTAVAFTNTAASGAWGDLVSISLTPGDWDVSGRIDNYINTATWTDVSIGISDTAGNSSANLTRGLNFINTSFGSTSSAVVEVLTSLPSIRWKTSTSTTLYLKIKDSFSAGQPQAIGSISARRAR